MSLFKVPHNAEDVGLLKCLRWRDRTEEEIVMKFGELFPTCLIMVEKTVGLGVKKERTFVPYRREFDVPSYIKNAVHKGFIGIRKREGNDTSVDEFFITQRGLDVLEPKKEKEKE